MRNHKLAPFGIPAYAGRTVERAIVLETAALPPLPPGLYSAILPADIAYFAGVAMVYPDFSAGVKEVDLGAEDSFARFPAVIALEGGDFYLARSRKGEYKLLSSLCPHSWGTIYLEDTCFMCPSHGWRFEYYEGNCINGPIAQMYSFAVTARNGHLFAELPNK